MARKFNLQQTKGDFTLVGNTIGTKRNNAFRSGVTQSGKEYVSMNIGVQTDEKQRVFVELFGMQMDNVFISEKDENGKHKKTVKVAWKDRKKQLLDNQQLIGVKIGVIQQQTEDGLRNKNLNLTNFDAVNLIQENITDNEGVFVRGNISYSSFTDKNGNFKRQTKLIPIQFSKTVKTSKIDFTTEGFEPNAFFEQEIVFMEVIEVDGKKYINGYVVDFNDITSVDFEIKCKEEKVTNQLFKNLQTLKPYTKIKIYGIISHEQPTETIDEFDGWGDVNKAEQISSFKPMRLIVTGADQNSIDDTIYNAKEFQKVLRSLREFGGTDVEEIVKNSTVEDNPWDDM